MDTAPPRAASFYLAPWKKNILCLDMFALSASSAIYWGLLYCHGSQDLTLVGCHQSDNQSEIFCIDANDDFSQVFQDFFTLCIGKKTPNQWRKYVEKGWEYILHHHRDVWKRFIITIFNKMLIKGTLYIVVGWSFSLFIP